MGFEHVTDYSLAARTMIFDIHTRTWSDEILKKSGIDKSRLARVLPSGEVVGKISPKIAKELGLSLDTVAVLGGTISRSMPWEQGVISAPD